MKIPAQSIRVVAVVGVLLATSHAAFALKTFNGTPPIAAAPSTGNATVGVATTNTATVTVMNGSSGSSSFKGTAQLTATSTNGTVTATLSSTTFNFTTTSMTWNSTLTVITTAGTPAGTYTIQLVADTNSPPTPDNIVPVTNTYTLTVSSGGAFVPQTIWTGAGANQNWSTVGNWSQNAVPVSSNDVLFIDNTGAPTIPGTVDDVVSSSLTIGSLTYGPTNTTHTTQISPGAILTVGGDANGLVVGTGADNGGLVTVNTITGSALAVNNNNANVFVSQSTVTTANAIATAQATLDMSGLNNFTATISRLLIGADLAIKGASGQLNLAKTNNISVAVGSAAPQIDIGDNSQTSGSPAIPSVLLLGQTNLIMVDSITVGRGKTDIGGYQSYQGPVMTFNSAFNSPTAYFRGTNGLNSRVGTWTIGDGDSARTYYAYGTCDFSLGTVNALVNTMNVGLGSSTSQSTPDAGNGTLTMAGGIMDINTLNIGTTVKGTGAGIVNVNGGTLQVDSLLELGNGGSSSGTLNISNGTVIANSGVTVGGGNPAVIAMTGGTLSATNKNATIGTAAFPLNNFSVSNSTLTLPVQSLVPTVAADNLVANGTANTINISIVPVLTGFPAQFTLIQYGLNGGSASGNTATFVLGTLPTGVPPYSAFISNNVANNSIDIVFTSGPVTPILTWDGTPNGNWNLVTANWKPASGPDTTYANGDFAVFNDSLAGTPNVNLTTALTPGTITVSNSAVNYAFSGAGNLSGSMTLVKYGPGTLSLAETGGDNFSGGILVTNGKLILDNASSSITGGTTISGGTLQIGNNDSNGAVPAGNLTIGGALIFDQANNLLVTNAIDGAGTLTQNDTNIVTVTGDNSAFTGMAIAAQGTLQIGNSNSIFIGASSLNISNGATLDTGGQALFGGSSALQVSVSGTGVAAAGAIVNNSANSPTLVLHLVTLTGDTTFGGTSSWDIRNSSGNSTPSDGQLSGAFNLTKVNTNTVTLRGLAIDPGLGNINIQAGGLHFTYTAAATLNSLGNPNATITVFSNATVTLDTIGTIPTKNFVLTNSGTLACSSTNVFGDPLTLTGAANNTISVGNSSQFTITSIITGNGGLSKNGSGPLFLEATNTYTGNTVISGGTLALYGGGANGAIASSALINVTGGATLDVSGRSDDTFTLAVNQTLNGGAGTSAGSINGILVAGPGSILAPGTGTTNTGAIDVSSNATLQGATQMKLNATTGSNDTLRAYAVVYGGTLFVTNDIGTITNDQTSQLFVSSNGVYNAGTFSLVTLPTAPGLSWTNHLSSNGTIIAGVVPVSPTPPVITGFNLTGSQLIISGTSSSTNTSFTYSLLGATNLLTPLANWTILSTGNAFNPGGNFRLTNTVNPYAPQNYYLLRVP